MILQRPLCAPLANTDHDNISKNLSSLTDGEILGFLDQNSLYFIQAVMWGRLIIPAVI